MPLNLGGQPHGLLWMGTDCSSFTFPNISNHKRTKLNPAGDRSYAKTVSGSLMADVALVLFWWARKRGLTPVIENPRLVTSSQWSHHICHPSMEIQASQFPIGFLVGNPMGSHGMRAPCRDFASWHVIVPWHGIAA